MTISKRAKVWILETIGKKPSPRTGHSLSYISSINSLLIYGGKVTDNKGHDNNLILGDVYLFNI